VNEEWISDKTRFVWDGLKTQRLDRPYVRRHGRLEPATWAEAFVEIANKVRGADPKRVGAIAGDLATVEEMFALRELMKSLGVVNLDCRAPGEQLDPAAGRASYIFNPGIAGIDRADAILIVGSNPRHEAGVLNARIRKRWRQGDVAIALVGEKTDLTYPYEYLGAGPDSLAQVDTTAFGKALANAKRPLVIVGSGAYTRSDGPEVLALAARLATGANVEEGWNGLAVLHTAAARVGGLDLRFVPGHGGLDTIGMVAAAATKALDVLFLLGADELTMNALGSAFVVYIGSHGDAGAHRADVILPGAAYTEKSGTYVNTEGRVQIGNRAAFPPGEARDDWAILRALSDVLGKRLPFDSLTELRRALYASYPHLARVDEFAPGALDHVRTLAERQGKPTADRFQNAIDDFYATNPIARASAVMAECSAVAAGRLSAAAE
jgi:NADH-quinone oxidoreductase subunit G